MPKGSTKYQVLKADFDQVIKELRQMHKMLEHLRKEKQQAYHDGYKQGRFDEKMERLNM
jgi:transposase